MRRRDFLAAMAGGLGSAMVPDAVSAKPSPCRRSMIRVPRGCVSPPGPGLLGPSDLTFLGSFKVPGGTFGTDSFGFSSMQMASNVYYDPNQSHAPTIFVAGQRSAGYVSATPSLAQISIPALLDPNVVGLAGLNTATVYQNFADPSDGRTPLASEGVFGYVIYQGHLIGVGATSYDASGTQATVAFVNSSLNLSSPSAAGPYAMAVPTDPIGGALKQTLYGGYACHVPAEWQSALGAKVVCGNTRRSIISVNSAGPAIHTIDVDHLITKPTLGTTIATNALAYYWPEAHWSLGGDGQNEAGPSYGGQPIPTFMLTDPDGRVMPPEVTGGPTWSVLPSGVGEVINGIVCPGGTRSVLYFGRRGLGLAHYGEGTANPALHGTEVPGFPDVFYYYDPPNVGIKGGLSYPYAQCVWAYDINDYIRVRNGTLDPWMVRPYAHWVRSVWPGEEYQDGWGYGATWDPVTRRIYCAGYTVSGGATAVIHVYRVA